MFEVHESFAWETPMSISLIESKRASKTSARSTVVSIALHAAGITLAVYATASAREMIPAFVADTTHFVYTPPAPDPAPSTPHTSRGSTGVPSPPRKPITFSPTFGPTIPAVSISMDSVGDDRGLFGEPGPNGNTPVDGGARSGTDATFDVHHVDKAALPRDGNPAPRYPVLLERSRVEGTVLAQFVVDTLGRAEMSTLKILDSSNDLFSESLRSALAQWRFYPAVAGGRRVRQIVQLPLKFVAPHR